jgi:hypothetical protein
MKLYEINEAILNCVDPETGEIADAEAFDSLMMQRDEKLENIALYIKNLTAFAKDLGEQEKIFAERKKAAQKKAESLKDYLAYALDGQKFATAKCEVSFRKSVKVEITDEKRIPPDFIRITAKTEPNKEAITAAIKAGQEVSGATLIENLNINIK